MNKQPSDWFQKFLDHGEQQMLTFESSKEVGAAAVAAAGGFGVAGALVAAAVTSHRTTATGTPAVWVGRVVLTNRRLLLIDGHGISRSLDRSDIAKVELSRSQAGAWMRRIEVEAGGVTHRLHAKNQVADHLAQLVAIAGSTNVMTNATDIAGLLKATPVIFLMLIGLVAIVAGAASGTWLAVPVGAALVGGGEWLRRLLFSQR